MAYGQNARAVRVEQRLPIRLDWVPVGGRRSAVKYRENDQVVDKRLHTWNESMNHSSRDRCRRPNRAGYHFSTGRISDTRPSAD